MVWTRLKKRKVLISLVCVLACLLPVLLVSRLAVRRTHVGPLYSFGLGDPVLGRTYLGAGLNLSGLEELNLLENSSFEPLVYQEEFAVYAGGKDKARVLAVDMPEQVPAEDFFLGAKAYISSPDRQGWQLKKTTEVKDYQPDQLDQFHDLPRASDQPDKLKWLSFAEKAGNFYAGSDQGYILKSSGYSDSSLLSIGEQAGIVGLAALADKSLLAVTDMGKFYQSEDGDHWQLADFSLDLDRKIRSLTSIQDAKGDYHWLAVGDQGLAILDGKALDLPINSDLTACVAGEKSFFVCGRRNSLFEISLEGELRLLPTPYTKEHWQYLDYRRGVLMAIGSSGNILVRKNGEDRLTDNSDFVALKSAARTTSLQANKTRTDVLYLKPVFNACVVLNTGKLLLSDQQGLVFSSLDLGASWQLEPEIGQLGLEKLRRMPSGMVVAVNDQGDIRYAATGSVFTFQDALSVGTYESGDRIKIEKYTDRLAWQASYGLEALEGEWYSSKPGAARLDLERVGPGGGSACLHLSNDQVEGQDFEQAGWQGLYSGQVEKSGRDTVADTVRVRQKISAKYLPLFDQPLVLRLEYWAKASLPDRASLSFSLNGKALDLQVSGQALTHDWQKYTANLVVPAKSLLKDQDSWFQLTYKGKGSIWLDRLSLRPSDQRQAYLVVENSEPKAKLYRDQLTRYTGSNPGEDQLLMADLCRLDNLSIGQRGQAEESWLVQDAYSSFRLDRSGRLQLAEQNSLAKSLEICRQIKAKPCLVISNSIKERELRHLMQYLLGNNNTEYGQLRLEQGMSGRYTDIFPQIYLEFVTEEGSGLTDQAKAAFVDWAISVVTSTQEFKQHKNKIFFVDGMAYQEGTILSQADCYSANLSLNTPEDKSPSDQEIEDLAMSLVDCLPRDPDHGSRGRSVMIKSVPAKAWQVETAGRAVSLELQLLTQEVNSRYNVLTDPYLDLKLAIGRALAGKNRLSLMTDESHQAGLDIFAYRQADNQDLSLVLANTGDSPVTCQPNNFNLTGYRVSYYDSQGKLLTSEEVSKDKPRLTVLPGSVALITNQQMIGAGK